MAPKTITFHSRYTEHEIIRRPRNQVPLPMGGGWQTVGEPRISYQFHAAPAPDGKSLIGVCHVQVGRNKMVDGDGWLAAGLEQKERDDVDALRAHEAFGRDFWEAGHAPGTLYPRPQDFRRELMEAATGLHEERLVAMLVEERKSHARRELIEDAEAALENVRVALAQATAQAEAEAKPKAGAKA
jgi:hypothetical protein